jgi:hypothetical protein
MRLPAYVLRAHVLCAQLPCARMPCASFWSFYTCRTAAGSFASQTLPYTFEPAMGLGDKVKLAGKFPAEGFGLFFSDALGNVVFEFNPLPAEQVVVRNGCSRDGKRGHEETWGGMPFTENADFEVVIERSGNGFWVSVGPIGKPERRRELDFTQARLVSGCNAVDLVAVVRGSCASGGACSAALRTS